MNSLPSRGGSKFPAPKSVQQTRSPAFQQPQPAIRVVRTLGAGRAARAQLVDTTMPNGEIVRCVEKVFAPGRLTRAIYRIGFAAPFAYQSNIDAILACFYRRRVAAGILHVSDIDVQIAAPLYVRFDEVEKAWVLAAEWVDGRGIRPAAPDPNRGRRWISRQRVESRRSEVDQLVELMGEVETTLVQCGLSGSGWQVSPRAMVSTANLLRRGENYTVIDLESGIPAVLVPKYLVHGLYAASLPPFDDLDADRLQRWMIDNERALLFRLGPSATAVWKSDVEKLIKHTVAWKASELALFRRPWRLLSRDGLAAYQTECLRRWQQDGVVDEHFAAAEVRPTLRSRLLWWTAWLPPSLGAFAARSIGRADARRQAKRFLIDSQFRRQSLADYLSSSEARLKSSQRVATNTQLTAAKLIGHKLLSVLPAKVHRFAVDNRRRNELTVTCILLLFSNKYQAWFGNQQIEASIYRWHETQRINDQEADELKQELCGNEVRVYARGFGLHLVLEAISPIVAPAKIGGIVAFLTGGSPWFLIPMLLSPVLRMIIAIANWWSARHESVRHREALAVAWLPSIGSIAFPLQMFASRPKLATFLIRDAASHVGRRLPIYGGADSRLEIACIRLMDFVIEAMEIATNAARLLPRSESEESIPRPIVPTVRRTRFGRWLDRQADEQIAAKVKFVDVVRSTAKAA